MRLSYSKLEAYETCPRMFYYKYVNPPDTDEEPNGYSQYGTLVHSLIDAYNKGELTAEQLPGKYAEEYIRRVSAFMDQSQDDSYYFAGYDYFTNFKGVIPDAEIIESEKKHIITVSDMEFSGIIDMVVKLPTGETAIIDHKSTASRYFRGKSADSKFRQLYIYAEILKQKTGAYPDKLIFNCFREKQLVSQDFNLSRHAEVMAWTNNMISQINSDLNSFAESESEWMAFPSFYWCRNICEHRTICTEVN